MEKELRENLAEIKLSIRDLTQVVTDHCMAQAATNQEVRDGLKMVDSKVRDHLGFHDRVSNRAWGLISGVILAILSGVGAFVKTFFFNGNGGGK
jgi:hypothetical protein